MESKISPSGFALRYGLISGGILLFFEFLLFVFGMANNELLANISFIIILVAVVFAIKHYRDRIQGGFINFGKALGMGVIVCLVASLITSVYTYLELKYFSPSLMQDLIVQIEEKMLEKGTPEEQIELITSFMSPGFISISYIFGSTFWGALFSAVIALILKKNENPLSSMSMDSELEKN